MTPSLLLHHIAAHDGELLAADLAVLASGPYPEPADRSSLDALRAWVRRREAWRADQAARCSRMLGKLVERGFVEPRGCVRLRPSFRRSMEARAEVDPDGALAWALEREHPAWPGRVPDLRGHLGMVLAVAGGESAPLTVRDVLGASPSGHRQRVWADLVAWGVVVHPDHRRLTARGWERVGRERATC